MENDQKSQNFWDRIKGNYKKYRGIGLGLRKWQQLKPRYYWMSKEKNIFVECYKDANNPPKSRYSEKNTMADVRALYLQSTHKEFYLAHARRLPRDELKWRGEAIPGRSRRQKHSADRAYTPLFNLTTPIDCSEYCINNIPPFGLEVNQKKGQSKKR